MIYQRKVWPRAMDLVNLGSDRICAYCTSGLKIFKTFAYTLFISVHFLTISFQSYKDLFRGDSTNDPYMLCYFG